MLARFARWGVGRHLVLGFVVLLLFSCPVLLFVLAFGGLDLVRDLFLDSLLERFELTLVLCRTATLVQLDYNL